MKNNFLFSLSVLLIASFANAKAISPNTKAAPGSPLSENVLMEELTGKKSGGRLTTNAKNAPLPVQHFLAGQKAADEKNYIVAIKHFNTVLKKYPHSQQVKPTLLAKAKIYKEMGLKTQAEHNLKMAKLNTIQKSVSRATTQTAKSSERTKSVK